MDRDLQGIFLYVGAVASWIALMVAPYTQDAGHVLGAVCASATALYIIVSIYAVGHYARHETLPSWLLGRYLMPNRMAALGYAFQILLIFVFSFGAIYYDSPWFLSAKGGITHITSRIDAFYYSMATFTTIGDSSYVPTHAGKLVMSLELFLSLLLFVCVIALVISRIASFSQSKKVRYKIKAYLKEESDKSHVEIEITDLLLPRKPPSVHKECAEIACVDECEFQDPKESGA